MRSTALSATPRHPSQGCAFGQLPLALEVPDVCSKQAFMIDKDKVNDGAGWLQCGYFPSTARRRSAQVHIQTGASQEGQIAQTAGSG